MTERTTTVTATADTQPADLFIILRLLLKGGDDCYIESVRQRALKGDNNDLRDNE